MNKYEFYEGGYPLGIEYLKTIEERIGVLEKLCQFLTPYGLKNYPENESGFYSGGLVLDGCNIIQDTNETFHISNGWIMLYDKIIKVATSQAMTNLTEQENLYLHINEISESVIYEDGQSKKYNTNYIGTIDKNATEGIKLNSKIFTLDNKKNIRLLTKDFIDDINSKVNSRDSCNFKETFFIEDINGYKIDLLDYDKKYQYLIVCDSTVTNVADFVDCFVLVNNEQTGYYYEQFANTLSFSTTLKDIDNEGKISLVFKKKNNTKTPIVYTSISIIKF